MRRDLSWKELVEKSWGKEMHKPDIAYEFSNSRVFYDRGQAHHGDGIPNANAHSVYADDYADDYS